MQSKKQSLLESFVNIFVGFIISFASTFLIFPLVGFESTSSKNLIITIFFTVISFLRSYILRRIFNKESKNEI